MVPKNFYTVSDITRYIKNKLDTDIILSDIYIQGEVSNLKYHYSGHVYFTLKDEKSVMRSVMFKSKEKRLSFKIKNGMKIVVRGYISLYEPLGQYQLYVESIKKKGTGDLHAAFEKLKEKLSKEGLFDKSLKKQIPFLPEKIAVVTSATGSVIKDIIKVLTKRFENFNLILYPVRVQGVMAAKEIAHALQRINESINADVIILARGGGSLEEIWPFNEEITARSIFKSKIPVISAVGHETDFTISDFVSDVRAATPSAAAEIVMPDKKTVKRQIIEKQERIIRTVKNDVENKKDLIKRMSRQLKMPVTHRLDRNRLKCDNLISSMINAIKIRLKDERNKLNGLAVKLDALGPLNIMKRGFSFVVNKNNGKIIKSVDNVKKGDFLDVLLYDGSIETTVKSKDDKKPGDILNEVENK